MPEAMIDFNSPLVWTLLTGAVVAVIGAFFTGLSQAITAWRTLAHKVVAIDAHVNSEKTQMDGERNTLKAENTLLRELLEEQKREKALLAQAVAAAAAVASATAVVPMPPTRTGRVSDVVSSSHGTGERLKQIEQNTAATVDALKDQAAPSS